MSGQNPRREWNPRTRRYETPVLTQGTAQAMTAKTGSFFCPRCHLPGELKPGEACPYCGYYLRCVGCGD
jgi:hypothetical protein